MTSAPLNSRTIVSSTSGFTTAAHRAWPLKEHTIDGKWMRVPLLKKTTQVCDVFMKQVFLSSYTNKINDPNRGVGVPSLQSLALQIATAWVKVLSKGFGVSDHSLVSRVFSLWTPQSNTGVPKHSGCYYSVPAGIRDLKHLKYNKVSTKLSTLIIDIYWYMALKSIDSAIFNSPYLTLLWTEMLKVSSWIFLLCISG